MSAPVRNLFQHLPPPAECLALCIATLELVPFGIAGLRNPATFADGYGLSITGTPATSLASTKRTDSRSTATSGASEDEMNTKKALVAAVAARNMQNGILLFTFGLILRDRRSLGVAVMAGLVATIADTVIVKTFGAKDKISGHYLGVFNSLAVGGSLLYWGSSDALWEPVPQKPWTNQMYIGGDGGSKHQRRYSYIANAPCPVNPGAVLTCNTPDAKASSAVSTPTEQPGASSPPPQMLNAGCAPAVHSNSS